MTALVGRVVAGQRSPRPAGGDWLLVLEVSSRRPLLALAVERADGSLSWSAYDVDDATDWLRKCDAVAAARSVRVERGRARIRAVHRAEAVELLRLARAGLLREARGS